MYWPELSECCLGQVIRSCTQLWFLPLMGQPMTKGGSNQPSGIWGLMLLMGFSSPLDEFTCDYAIGGETGWITDL